MFPMSASGKTTSSSSSSSSPPRKVIKLTDQTSLPPGIHDQQSNVRSNENETPDKGNVVHFLDIGCGYGGLLVALSPLFPEKNILGIEIRVKVCDYVQDRIRALRAAAAAASPSSHCSSGILSSAAATDAADASIQSPDRSKAAKTENEEETLKDGHEDNGNSDDRDPADAPAAHISSSSGSGCSFQNIACIRSNAMKYLPNFFPKASMEKMFFLFPDPHFKKQKHKWRIISQQLLSEYAYVLQQGAKVYIATDVKDLYDWMVGHFHQHPLFIEDEAGDQDPVLPLLFESTEEGRKVTRMGGQKFAAVFIRIPDPAESHDIVVQVTGK